MLKRTVSVLIPYRRKGNEVMVYLQKRKKDAKRLPGYFGFFGGGAEEGEAPEETLLREIKEELNYTLPNYHVLGDYDFPDQLYYVYYMEAEDTFENKIEILEGDYGKWFSKDEAMREEKLIQADKIILQDLYKKVWM